MSIPARNSSPLDNDNALSLSNEMINTRIGPHPSLKCERNHATHILLGHGFRVMHLRDRFVHVAQRRCRIHGGLLSVELDLGVENPLTEVERVLDKYDAHVYSCPRIEDAKHYDGMGAE